MEANGETEGGRASVSLEAGGPQRGAELREGWAAGFVPAGKG